MHNFALTFIHGPLRTQAFLIMNVDAVFVAASGIAAFTGPLLEGFVGVEQQVTLPLISFAQARDEGGSWYLWISLLRLPVSYRCYHKTH